MLHTLKIELLTEMLGGQNKRSDIKVFPRLKDGRIAFSLPIWSWAIQNAARQMQLSGLNDEAIRPEMGWSATPRVAIYKRNWSANGVPRVDTFESFPTGAVLEVKIFLADPYRGIGGQASVSIDELHALASYVGEYFGLSPWGSKFGYGRFRVISLIKI